MQQDLQTFFDNISWFNLKKRPIEFYAKESDKISNDFNLKFPKMALLLNKSRQSYFSLDERKYKLVSWTNLQNESCGWLCEICEELVDPFPLLTDHKMLLIGLDGGGISESYNGPEKATIDDFKYNYTLHMNQNFIFTASKCTKGLGDWANLYEDFCLFSDVKPIEYENLICFALEANGNKTLYSPTSGEVLLYAHDHNFDFVKQLINQPAFTFYTINGIDTFTDYVELLAQQWLDWVK